MRRKSHSAAVRYARLGRERRRRSSAPFVPEAPAAPRAEPAPAQPGPRLARPVAAPGGSPRPHDFSVEYTYLASDLRRIAVVAGGLLLAMILGARLLP